MVKVSTSMPAYPGYRRIWDMSTSSALRRYLHTTPELLDLAGNRLRRRYKTTTSEDDSV